jgi:hypothetical protein
MRKRLVVIAALAVSWIVTSCDWGITEEGGVDLVKPPIVLLLTVTNSMDVPIDVQMRHHYKKSDGGGVRTIRDPVECTIPAGDSGILGDETVTFLKDGVETKWPGFVLLDDELVSSFGGRNGYSSFELKVTAGDTVIQLAGYEAECLCFDDMRLCDLWVEVESYSDIWRKVLLFDKPTKTWHRLEEPTLLTASLLINADGTYVFDMEPPF